MKDIEVISSSGSQVRITVTDEFDINVVAQIDISKAEARELVSEITKAIEKENQ